jgi:CRP-like cAMP-binding protein
MSASSPLAGKCGNYLLSTLTDDGYAALAPRLQRIHMVPKDVVGERNTLIDYIYFPCGAVLSVLAYMSDGTAIEVGTAGREGFCGIEVLVAGERWTETTICQVEGDCFRMSVKDFKEAIQADTPLLRATQQYMQVYLALVSQSVACNRLHTIEERFSRWVLMTHDRVDGDVFHLTQEFLAVMLGVQRPSVSLVASSFQQAGLIRYHRGRMTILNRHGLEETCCECYAAVRQLFHNVLKVDRG